MLELDRDRLWSEFLAVWSPSRIEQMTLEEYTNPKREDAFIYWIEKRLEKLGSIWGGSAFKFGIYRRDNLEAKAASSGRVWGEQYAWLSKFGTTEQSAFATIRGRLVEVVNAAEEGNFERIEEIDLSPTLKWKVAFLYQNRKDPSLFPIFKKEALFINYLKIDPRARLGVTPYYVMYETLMERHAQQGDVFEIASLLWQHYESDQNRSTKAWAVPIAWALKTTESVEALCSKFHVEPEDVDPFLDNLLSSVELSEGDQLALLADGDVRALCTLTNVEPGQFAWDQAPANFPSLLLVNPTYEVRQLNATEREELWKHLTAGPKTRVASIRAAKTSSEPGPCKPESIILYGPPGTGKTYSTVRRALQLVLGPEKVEGLGDKGLLAVFREHQARGQIEFVTFHQSYGYEEFVEGLRPVLGEDTDDDVRYELHDGVFKRIALRAAAEGLAPVNEFSDFDELWQRLLDNIRDGDTIAKGPSGKSYVLRPSIHGNISTVQCDVDAEGNIVNLTEKRQLASKKFSKILWDQRNSFGVTPENLTYQKALEIFQVGNHYTALWIVYNQLLSLNRFASTQKDSPDDKAPRVQQALNKAATGRANFSFSAENRQYVLIIDEINRGNVSKILGELITLLDPDKRLGADNELKLPLSYSPTNRFAVPPNLHVLGTMNTADRSLALMDVALRRRFTFEELMPNPNIISEQLSKQVTQPALIELVVDLFKTINNRIRFLYDRDHQLGHSYFLNVDSLESLRLVFVNRVIPLLQEYFYGSWEKVCMVLGCPYDESGNSRRTHHALTVNCEMSAIPIIEASKFEEFSTLGFDHDSYEDRIDFHVRSDFQFGRAPREELIQTFLNVLELPPAEIQRRFALLCAENSIEQEGSE